MSFKLLDQIDFDFCLLGNFPLFVNACCFFQNIFSGIPLMSVSSSMDPCVASYQQKTPADKELNVNFTP